MFNAAPPAPAPPPPPPAPPPPPPPPPMLAANAPPAPMFDADMIANAAASLKSRQPVVETHTSFEQTTVNNDFLLEFKLIVFLRKFQIFLLFLLKASVVLVVQNRLHTLPAVSIFQKYANQLVLDGMIASL
jgi:hypothetical protein